MRFLNDLRYAARSFRRSKGLTLAVTLTLALGIGANAALFGVVRGVLLKPLNNRDEARLIYIRQSAPGIGIENLTFSVPEIEDLRRGVKSLSALGDFSTIRFTMVGLGEPRAVKAGVVGGSFFEVMGLRPVIGRLLSVSDDGPRAAPAAVLMHRFWASALGSDPTVVGKTIRLGSRMTTIVGVLEPSVPYPSETEVVANVVTSPHHLSATMATGREHRMTELFGRLAPGVTLEAARAELQAVHRGILTAHPEVYIASADYRIEAVLLRDQITSRARTVLLLLFAASALIFVIACSNVANLILARNLRREGELAVRSALGAGAVDLRRTLFAESVLLCGTGAILGVAIARPMAGVLAHYAARFSARTLDLQSDTSMLWIAMALAIAASVLLAFVPRLPSPDASHGLRPSNLGGRSTGPIMRRLRLFAVVQVAASFVLVTGAATLLRTLLELRATNPGFATSVLAINVPVVSYGRTPAQIRGFYQELRRRVLMMPGVERVAVGTTAPWRDAGHYPGFRFSVEGRRVRPGEEDPLGAFRSVAPGYFAALSIPLLAGRDFTDADRSGAERVVIIGKRVAERMFPNQDPLNRHMMWTDKVMPFIGISTEPRRIVGIVEDVNDEQIEPTQALLVYHPFDQEIGGGRLFVQARTEPYSLVPAIMRIVRELAADQPVERAATLEDLRAEVLAPSRLNTIVFGGFAALALAIAVVGVSGVLAFAVSGRTRELGIRMAMGSQSRAILLNVLGDGAAIAVVGIVAGAAIALALTHAAAAYLHEIRVVGLVPAAVAAAVLFASAAAASLLPALRASRVDILEALRTN